MSVGASASRFDAASKVTGATRYAGDDVPADALFAVTVFSGQSHARMTAMNTSAAESAPGVITIVTAADVPVNCLLYTSPSPRDQRGSRMPSSA